MIDVAIGVVLFNTDGEDLYKLLMSAVRQDDAPDHRVHLILKANDGLNYQPILQKVIDEMGPENTLTMIDGTDNCGFGAGHNKLIDEAAGRGLDYYVGCNPDGRLHHLALGHFLREAEQTNGHVLFEFRQFPEEHPKTYDFFDGTTSWISGACFAAKASFLSKMKFDENIRMYCEDVDLSWRVKAEGGKCVLLPKCLFFHDMTDKRDRHTVRVEMLKSGRYLAWKWGSTGFQEIMEDELVRAGVADERRTLPPLKGERVPYPQDEINKLTEFRRLFSFSPARW